MSLLENLISAVAHTDGFWDDLAAWWYQRQTDWLSTANLTPNAPSTLARKGDPPRLVDSGALRDSSRLNQPFNINRGLDESATFGLRKAPTPTAKRSWHGPGPAGHPPTWPCPRSTSPTASRSRWCCANGSKESSMGYKTVKAALADRLPG